MATPKKEAEDIMLRNLACGATEASAARAAGVNVRTVQRRLAKPDFQKKLADYKAALPRRRDDMLHAGAIEGIKTLAVLLKEPIPAAVRFRAAQCLLAHSLQDSSRAQREAQVGEAVDAEAEARAAEELEEKRREFMAELGRTLAPFPEAKVAVGEMLRARTHKENDHSEVAN
jgi:hypothetical protein